MAAAANDPGAASGVLAPPSCGVPSGTPRRSSLRLPLSLPGSFASLTMVTRTDSWSALDAGRGVGSLGREATMAKDTLTVTDNRTGRSCEIPIEHGAIRAADLRPLGLVSYDPAFANTASCTSRITYIDGDAGVLLYRGYPIEQLAEQSTFLETAYLLIKGELPSAERLAQWTHNITMHTIVHENVKQFMDGFRYDAHPMGMLVATVGALSTFYPDARRIHDPESRRVQTHRLLAKMPTIAAFAHRHAIGQPYVYPDNELSYPGNFLSMMFKMTELKYGPDPVLERALDVLFILHADHEQNCSTNAMRAIGSSQVDPLSALAGACAALWGRLHGGADEAVLRMLAEIGSVAHVPAYLKRVKAGEARLVGFGHRVYRTFDPRGKVLKCLAPQVFAITGRNRLLDVALELERIAREDGYFVERKLYPNVEFYSGIIYQAMGFPVDMFPVLFAIARTAGWIAQWLEMVQDEEQKIARPRQLYLGRTRRERRDHVLKTRLCERLGIELPIIAAPMGFVTGPELAAAVSNAGGLGVMSFSGNPPPVLREEIRRLKRLTSRPFGVNLILYYPVEDQVAVCLEERVPVLSLFWGDPAPWVARAHAAGVTVMHP